MKHDSKKTFLFGPFRLDASKRLLLRDGKRVKTKDLTPKRFDLLCVFVQNPGVIMKKNDLIKAVWSEIKFDENDQTNKFRGIYSLLNNTVCKLREILGDDAKNPTYIETVTGVGYRFIAGVVELDEIAKTPLPKKIAVLPMKLMTQARRGKKYFGLEICSAIITKLNNIDGISVQPRSAIIKYHPPPQDPLLAAHELGVDYVLVGFICISGKEIRVDVELLDTRNNEMVWSASYREEIKNNLAVQEIIAKQIAHHIAQHFRLGLSSREREQIKKEDTRSTRAYEAYVLGRYYWNRFTRKDFDKAIECFERAIKEDPEYGKAYAARADCFIWKGIYSLLPPKKAFNEAEKWAKKANRIDSELASAYSSLAFVNMCNRWDWTRAEEGFQTAIRLNPNHTKSRLGYALLHAGRGRFAEALSQIDRALEIYSASLILNVAKGFILFEARQFDRSVDQFLLVLEYDPTFDAAYVGLALGFVQQGKFTEAIEAAQEALDRSHKNLLNKAVSAYAYAKAGAKTKARRILAELNDQNKTQYISPFHLAAIHVALGKKEPAFERLREAHQQRDPWMVLLGVDPRFDELRDDRRFKDFKL